LEKLKEHLKKFIDVDPIELDGILDYFKIKTVAKKENILEEGQVCKSHFFVSKGVLRKFFVNEKGVEQTTEFAIENWWITDNMAFEHKLVTSFYIQAVEKSDLIYISQENQNFIMICSVNIPNSYNVSHNT